MKYKIKKFSNKRQKANRLYKKVREEFLADNYLCQAGLPGCTTTATEVHHQQGRISGNLIDVSTFVAVCHNCHGIIENEPIMAKEKGFSKSRLHV